MRKILIILLLFGWMGVRAQYPAFMPEFKVMNTKVDIQLHNAVNGAVVLLRGLTVEDDGQGGFFQWDATSITAPDGVNVFAVTGVVTGRWLRMNVYAGSTGTVTSVATNNGTGITGGTITTTGTLAIDTLLISTRAWRQKGIDSVAAKLVSNYSKNATRDSTVLLLNDGTRYAAKDSIGTIDISGKLNISDTASMLNPYKNKVDTIYRTAGKDSIQFTINNRYHAIRDSIGTSGGGTLSHVYAPLITSGDTISQRFNVLHYGASPSNTYAQNTTAFTSCLAAVIAAGGGIMYIPTGLYLGKITIPDQGSSFGSLITIVIEGEGQPNTLFGSVGSYTLTTKNTIIKDTSTTAGAAIIAAGSTFSAVNVIVRNLEVRTYTNPIINAIDLGWAQQMRLENLVISTGVYSTNSVNPTNGSTAIITPRIQNAASTIIRNVTISGGYYNGVIVNEHTDADALNIFFCYKALNFQLANHPSHFSRLGVYECTYNVYVTSTHRFWIDQAATEHVTSGGAWYQRAFDVLDSANRGVAQIFWTSVSATLSAIDHSFTLSGGSGVQTSEVGNGFFSLLGNNTATGTNTFSGANTFTSTSGLTVAATSADLFLNNTSVAPAGAGRIIYQRGGVSKFEAKVSNGTTDDYFILDNTWNKYMFRIRTSDRMVSIGADIVAGQQGTGLNVDSTGKVGIGIAPVNYLDISFNAAANVFGNIKNATTGNGQAGWTATNNSSKIAQMSIWGTGKTTYGTVVGGDELFYGTGTGMNFMQDASGPMRFQVGTGAPAALRMNIETGGSIDVGGITSAVYRTTNAGGDVTSMFNVNTGGSISTAGSQAFMFDNTAGLVFGAGNGTREIARAAIKLTNLTNTAASEAGDLIFSTEHTGGAAISESWRISSAGYLSNTAAVGTSTTDLTGGSFALAYVAKTANYTATIANQTIDFTANADTLTLPTAVGITGRIYTVVNSGAGACQIKTTSSQTFVNINAAPTTLDMAAVGAGAITSYTVMSNGANWIVTAKVKNE